MAAVMIAGMTPPLGLALSNLAFPHKYPDEMRENAIAAIPMGLSFITEGAIPYAADPLGVIPSIMVGSATANATAMALGVGMPAPHGIFVVVLASNILRFLGAIVLGTVVTAAMVTLLKPDQAQVDSVEATTD